MSKGIPFEHFVKISQSVAHFLEMLIYYLLHVYLNACNCYTVLKCLI